MENWKKNLWVCWLAVFVVSSGMSQMAPILPLYIEHLGIHGHASIARWSGVVYGINFISLAIFSPIWGRFADRYGRRPMMMRASLWLALIMMSMGFAQNVYQLTVLRALQGALAGFQSAAVTLVAAQTPKARAGWALGMLFSGQVGGTLLGPLFGGYLSEAVGFRTDFVTVGALCLVAFVATVLFIKEENCVVSEHPASAQEIWHSLPQPRVTVGLFVTTLIMQLALMSIQPVITVYIAQLSQEMSHIALIAGAVFAASGLASVIASPWLGRLSDKIGAQKVLLLSLVAAGLLFLPQAIVSHAWQLGVLRFLLGLALAGLLPSVNSLIRKTTPSAAIGRIYGYNQSAQFLGMFSGSLFGGQLAAAAGIPAVLIVTGVLLLINAVWVYRIIYRPGGLDGDYE